MTKEGLDSALPRHYIYSRNFKQTDLSKPGFLGNGGLTSFVLL